ncbi:MAG: hypothetical protein RIC95_13895 [Vicingaceae bacterium]
MMEKVVVSFFIGLCFTFQVAFAQTPIPLTNQTTKIGALSEEFIYLGFKAGDEIVLTFEEKRKKGLKELEIKDFQSGRSLFSEYEIETVKQKRIPVPSTGIYQFRFYNPALGKRIGKIKIERIPAEEDDSFNSTVYWKTVYDTTYTATKEEYVVKEAYVPYSIIDSSEIYMNSGSNATFKGGKSRLIYEVDLPKGTVEWYYEIAAFREKDAIKNVNSSMSLLSQLTNLVDQTGATEFAISSISRPPADDYCDVYLFADYENASLFYQKRDSEWRCYPAKGRKNIKSEVVKLKDEFARGKFYLGLKNPDSMHGINVILEVVAIVHKVEKAERTIQVPNVSTSQVPYLK